jgi:hypothetical protein
MRLTCAAIPFLVVWIAFCAQPAAAHDDAGTSAAQWISLP